MGGELTPDRRCVGVIPKHRDAGVTLIELLVVVAVLAVLAVGVTITAVRGQGAATAADAQSFARAFDLARHLAVHSRQSQGLQITSTEWRLMRRTAQGWVEAAPARAWRGRATLSTDHTVFDPDTPEIVVLATGQSSAFDLVFSTRGDVARCASDGWDGVTCSGS